jgi:hypothetical protein
MGKAYDFEITTMVDDGVFNPAGLDVLKEFFRSSACSRKSRATIRF